MIESEVYNIDTTTFQDTGISPKDSSLIAVQQLDGQFDTNKDRVELYVYLQPNTLPTSNYNYSGWKSYQDPKLASTGKLEDLYLDPSIDAQVAGVTDGNTYVVYNFVNNKLLSSDSEPYYINTISSDRTELLLKTNYLNNETVTSLVNEFIAERAATAYFQEFYLNFGNNIQLVAVNIKADPSGVLIKLYEPLPSNLTLKDACWIQTRIADPSAYRVKYTTVIQLPDTTVRIKQANFNLPITGKVSNTTGFETLTSLTSTRLTSSYSQLSSLLVEKGVELNIDYTDFSNFVHFSSAETRLLNFYYKASLIESYNNDITSLLTTPSTIARSESIASKQGKIDSLITQFDGYDYYLYFESSSKAWPKTNSTPPYTLASTGSLAVRNWLGINTNGTANGTALLATASLYDQENQDYIVNSIPDYLREDPNNLAYQAFLEMVGQNFDTLYLYTDQISEKYNADNRLDYGISKDLVADTLRSFGVKLYQNNFTSDDLYTALIGLTPSGSTLLLPNITTAFPVTGSGLEYIQTIVSASNDNIPLDDLNKSIYKRLYHNLPLLVKKKGTVAGLQLLVNSYGIPDTILRVTEFGGKNKINTNDWDYAQHKYNYAFKTLGTGFANITWSTRDPLDPDVADFIRNVYADITDLNTIIALDTFVKGLKNANVWSKFWAIYPFVTNPGATLSARQNAYKVNLVDRTKYTISYVNGADLALNGNGVVLDGTNDYLNTNLDPSVASNLGTSYGLNYHGSIYIPQGVSTITSGARILYGIDDASAIYRLRTVALSDGRYFSDFSNTTTTANRILDPITGTPKAGYLLSSRLPDPDPSLAGIGTIFLRPSVTSSPLAQVPQAAGGNVYVGITGQNIFIGTSNVNGTPSAGSYYSGSIGFATHGYGLTIPESQTVSTLVTNLLTALGR
jgi:hypothetical protein